MTMKRARFALGVFSLLLLGGAALLLGVSGNGSHSARSGFAVKTSGDPDAGSMKETASVEAGPAAVTAAEEAYAQRAFPADEIPLQLSLDARQAWSSVKSRSNSNKNKAGKWAMIGPSHPNMPGLLVFSGADYTTSGRVTALALDPSCTEEKCRLWIGAAGGGIWRTKNAMADSPSWESVSQGLPTNAIGALTYDAASGTLYAGTGEPNSSADSEAGLGLFKSTNAGDTWTHVPALTTTAISGAWVNKDAFLNRGISQITVDPTNSSIIYVASASAVRGVCSVSNGCNAGPLTPLPARGVYKSTDGGATFTLLNGTTLPFVFRGATDVVLDPNDHNTVYASMYGQGVYRSLDGGTTWTQIFAPVNPANPSVIERASLAVNTLPGGKTRMYIGVGDNGTFASRLYRSDDAAGAAPGFVNITTAQSSGYCTAQCWYDNVVYTPPGHPDTVYLGGAYDYANAGTWAIDQNLAGRTNGRAYIRSTDGGLNFIDVTRDATSDSRPNGMHPDSHAMAVVPSNPNIGFFGSDGGMVRTSGSFADVSSQCASRNLTAADLAICQQLLSSVPTEIVSLNNGLATLQFQSLSVNPNDALDLMGGTQDNGTWEPDGHSGVNWNMIIWGDGGQSGFSASNPDLRFNTFTGQANDANFRGGDPAKWVVITGDIVASPESSYFYAPVTADPHPANGGTIYQGSFSVWRTQDWGGDQAFLEANCSEFTPPSNTVACGDFEPIGPAGHTNLRANDALYGGADRSGTNVAAIERGSDTSTIWAATGAGRVFVSKNGDAAAGSVTWTRIDNLPGATNDPGRFVSSIYVDPANANHAWLSYSGFNGNTPAQPGHVFEVSYNPLAGTATWTNLDGGSGPMGDLPATDLVRDDVTGDLYASTDFGVMMLPAGNGAGSWVAAGDGLPTVEVAGLTIVPGARKLYAATHGRSAWVLTLP
jgi:hypothetical protein